jgi:hexokinase
MKKLQNTVKRFLKRHKMDYQDVDMDSNVAAFRMEMQRGLAGRKGSLDMIPTYIEVGAEVPSNKRVIVADAGGTNFRVATVYFDDHKKPVIENLRLYQMPGVKQEVGKEEFFSIIAGYLKDVAAASDRIGFCFSYAVQMQPDKDGRLIRFSKEIKAKEVIGQLIGKNLNRALSNAGLGGNKHIVLLNDTVVTLLAGYGHNNRIYGSYIGFILGTGTNCCYIEKNSSIKKARDLDPTKSQIINTESGGFGKCHRGRIDVAFDKTTANPGVYKLEKMISGAYLGQLYLKIIQNACMSKLLSPAVAGLIQNISGFETKELNAFMLYPHGDNPLAKICKVGGDSDILTAYYIADRLIERAAKLTAINLSSIAIQSGQGADPTRPLCIVAEGTTFYQMKGLKSRVEFYLKQYLENKCGVYFDIVHIDNATLIGAAIAALTN